MPGCWCSGTRTPCCAARAAGSVTSRATGCGSRHCRIWEGFEAALREAARVLVPGGLLGLTFWGRLKRIGLMPGLASEPGDASARPPHAVGIGHQRSSSPATAQSGCDLDRRQPQRALIKHAGMADMGGSAQRLILKVLQRIVGRYLKIRSGLHAALPLPVTVGAGRHRHAGRSRGRRNGPALAGPHRERQPHHRHPRLR